LSSSRLRLLRRKGRPLRPPSQAAKADSPKVLVAVATKGGGLVNQHFGHAKEFMIYEVDAAEAKFIGHRKVADYCQGGYGEEAALAGIISTIADCKAILAAKVGPCPQRELQKLASR
jgi:nitrogen fixation protein NifB